jgi:hypothetical protein
MPRRSQLPPLALSDSDVMRLATWKRDTAATDDLRRTLNRRATLVCALGDSYDRDPFTRALNSLGVELLPAGQKWRLRCIGDEGAGIVLNRREWETLRHAILLDPRGVRAVVQACVDAQQSSKSREKEIVTPPAGAYSEPVTRTAVAV